MHINSKLRHRSRLLGAAALAVAFFAAAPAGAATLDRIRETGHIRFGFLDEARPFSFRGEGGAPDGYAIAVCKNIADQLKSDLSLPGLTIDWVPVDVNSRLSAVKNGDIDLLCAPTSVTLSRRLEASFSIPVFASGNRAAVRADTSATLRNALSENRPVKAVWRGTPAATVLQSTTFGVVSGTTGDKWLADRSKTLQVDARIKHYDDYEDALQDLNAGKVDVVFGDRVVMLGAMQQFDIKTRENLVVLDRMFTHEPAALALPRGDDDFRVLVDRALSRLYASSDFAQMYSKWVGEFDERARTFFVWNTLGE